MSCSLSLKMHNKLIIDTASNICTSDASYVTDEYKQSKREKKYEFKSTEEPQFRNCLLHSSIFILLEGKS